MKIIDLAMVFIPGPPGYKQRPRAGLNSRTKKIMAYTPGQTIAYEQTVRFHFMNWMGSMEDKELKWLPLEMPVCLIVTAFYPMPQAVRSKWEKLIKSVPVTCAPTSAHEKRAMEIMLGKTSKPDWDNVGKIISDAINGLAYRDDSQVVQALVTKIYWPGDPRQIGVIIRIMDLLKYRPGVVLRELGSIEETVYNALHYSCYRRDELFELAHEGKITSTKAKVKK